MPQNQKKPVLWTWLRRDFWNLFETPRLSWDNKVISIVASQTSKFNRKIPSNRALSHKYNNLVKTKNALEDILYYHLESIRTLRVKFGRWKQCRCSSEVQGHSYFYLVDSRLHLSAGGQPWATFELWFLQPQLTWSWTTTSATTTATATTYLFIMESKIAPMQLIYI